MKAWSVPKAVWAAVPAAAPAFLSATFAGWPQYVLRRVKKDMMSSIVALWPNNGPFCGMVFITPAMVKWLKEGMVQ